MTPKQHISQIISWFASHATEKYAKGAREHKGRLWRKPVMKSLLRPEVIDLVIYFQVLEEQWENVLHEIEMARSILHDRTVLPGDVDINAVRACIDSAYNLMQHGNREGEDEPDE